MPVLSSDLYLPRPRPWHARLSPADSAIAACAARSVGSPDVPGGSWRQGEDYYDDLHAGVWSLVQVDLQDASGVQPAARRLTIASSIKHVTCGCLVHELLLPRAIVHTMNDIVNRTPCMSGSSSITRVAVEHLLCTHLVLSLAPCAAVYSAETEGASDKARDDVDDGD
ncbi:hypothetical protein CYMTET_8722 [Cymbomonas tetramitiformis]|uniref:Uncharacterized protein n=1 Tax=Cymbomonas tetramitiformis TaxID=36881 RepID=A0AAE0LFK1_9CHLO|nr:hypothetical protein CYMTET_8722 [Cymbomonas tetramitiformis]